LVVFGTGEVKQPITLYDKTGKWLFESWLTVGGAARIFIQDASPTSKGTVVVAASSVDKDGASSDMIVEVVKGGLGRTIRTSPFYALRLCTTDEGTVWAYGVELTDDRRAERGLHYPMLREYSFEKGELRSALDRATVRPPRGVPVDGSPAEEFQMRCGFGKAVLVNGATRELIEYHFSASQLNRWPMNIQPEGYQVNGAALTESGDVYLSACRCGRPKSMTGMFYLRLVSAGTAEWVPLVVTPATVAPHEDGIFHLLGNDGADLVYSRDLRSSTIFWSEAPATNSLSNLGQKPALERGSEK